MKENFCFIVIISILLLTGCTSEEEPFLINDENISIRFATQMDHDQFTQLVLNPLKQEYPHIEFSLENSRDLVGNIERWVTSEAGPDIIIENSMLLGVYQNNNFFYDLEPLIKRNNYSTEHIYSNYIPSGDSNEVLGLPLIASNLVLVYNKDIFDAFNVPYPKNNITWEEVADLSRQVTGTLNNRNIHGLNTRIDFLAMASQLGVENMIDLENKQVNVETDKWRKIGETLQALYKDNPGNIPANSELIFDQMPFVNGNAAMSTFDPISMVQMNPRFEWDMTSYPVFSEYSSISPNQLSMLMLLNPNSQQKDAAFKLMTYLLSEEHQTLLSRSGYISVLSKGEIHEQFGQQLEEFAGKNIQGLFTQEPGARYIAEEFVSESEEEFVRALFIFLNHMQQIAIGAADIDEGLSNLQKDLEEFIE